MSNLARHCVMFQEMRPPLLLGESYTSEPDAPAEALGFDPILIFMDEPDPSKTSSLASALVESLSCSDRCAGSPHWKGARGALQHVAVENRKF